MMRLWIVSAGVSHRTVEKFTHAHLIGYRVCATEDEAIGSFARFVKGEKPGFSVDEFLCLEVPTDAMMLALGMGAISMKKEPSNVE